MRLFTVHHAVDVVEGISLADTADEALRGDPVAGGAAAKGLVGLPGAADALDAGQGLFLQLRQHGGDGLLLHH